MAAHSSMAASKVIILVLGAGVTGHIVLGKARLSDLIGNIQETLFKGNKGDIPGQISDAAAIQSQILRLAQEVKQLYGKREITVVNGNPSQNNSLASLIVPVAVVGVAGYCYMWWKGWSFSDIMYVTKRNMANAVSCVTKQLEQVSAALTATKRHLTQRMEKLNAKLDEQKEVTGAIRDDVGMVREDLARMGIDIDCVQRLVEGLEIKIDTIEGKQDLTNAGVVYLCQFVQGLAGAQRPEHLQSFPGKPRLERSPSSVIGVSGLKELQYFTEVLQSNKNVESGDGNTSPGETALTPENSTPGGTVHRTLKCY